jgi:hypothetical protein
VTGNVRSLTYGYFHHFNTKSCFSFYAISCRYASELPPKETRRSKSSRSDDNGAEKVAADALSVVKGEKERFVELTVGASLF